MTQNRYSLLRRGGRAQSHRCAVIGWLVAHMTRLWVSIRNSSLTQLCTCQHSTVYVYVCIVFRHKNTYKHADN